jgi:hypothetical protein
MAIPISSPVKLSALLLVGLAFAAAMIVYSNAVSNGTGFPEKWRPNVTFERTIEKSFEVSPGGELVVETDLGEVRVESWDKNEVNVIVEKSGSERKDRKFEITFDATKERVSVRGGPQRNWGFWDWGNFDVVYRIMTPTKFRVTVHTSGGDVVVRNIEGELKAGTSGGNVTASNIQGDVKLETSGGNIRAEGVVGSVDAETSGGDLRLDNVDGKIRGETSGGNVEVKLLGENKGIQVSTSGGNITLSLPNDVKADIDASTSGGEVKMRLEAQFDGKIEDEEVHGKINGGGDIISAETSGGDIQISSTSAKTL